MAPNTTEQQPMTMTVAIFPPSGRGGFVVTVPSDATIEDVARSAEREIGEGKVFLWTEEGIPAKEVASILVATRDNRPPTRALKGAPLAASPTGPEDVAVPKEVPRGPTPLPFIGNMLSMTLGPHSIPAYNIAELFPKYGPTFTLKIGILTGVDRPDLAPIFTSDPVVVEQLLKREADFPKMWTSQANKLISFLGGSGLFTSSTTDPSWKTARPLMSRPFNEVKIRQYFNIIRDKSLRYVTQLDAKVAAGGQSPTVVVDDMNNWNSCFTFDTVMEASLGVDLKNLEALGEGCPLDPFLPAFRTAFSMNIKFARGFTPIHYLNYFSNLRDYKAFPKAVATMNERMDELIESTRNGEMGGDKSVLHSLLFDNSPATSKKVALQNIKNQLVTLMVAGHETTAATMSFCLYHLANDKEAQERAAAEARSVIGEKGHLTFSDAGNMPYITACIRETLRLYSAVNLIQREAAQDTLIETRSGENLRVSAKQKIYVVLRGLHINEKDFPEGLSWKPERFLGSNERHPNSYHPFGFGVRSCVGQFFALWEAKTCLAMMLGKFSISLPKGFKFEPTRGIGASPFPRALSLGFSPRENPKLKPQASVPRSVDEVAPAAVAPAPAKAESDSPAVTIFYGSNVGACEELAQTVASTMGVNSAVFELNDFPKLDFKSSQVIIVSSTYNGQPPDNAKAFANWLEARAEEKKKLWGGASGDLEVNILGVGNSQWKQTFQHFPRFCRDELGKLGAVTQLTELDVANEWSEGFESWCSSLTQALLGKKVSPIRHDLLHVAKATPEDMDQIEALTYDHSMREGSVIQVRPLPILANRELCSGGDRSVRHVEVVLPWRYECGDHLAIRPLAPAPLVARAIALLKRSGEVESGEEWVVAEMSKKRARIRVKGLLSFLDLWTKPTRSTLGELSKLAMCPPEAMELQRLASEAGFEEVRSKEMTLLEVIESASSLPLSLSLFTTYFTIAKVRMYSISSAPSFKEEEGSAGWTASITVGVVDYAKAPLPGKEEERRHLGAASGMLASLSPGDTALGYVAHMMSTFRLDPVAPIIMVGPGTGIAPFRGFLQQRAVLGATSPAYLFFGCRRRDEDFLYKDELESLRDSGALTDLFVAFSREQKDKVYVQNKILEQKELVWRVLEAKGKVYVCGDAAAMAPDVRAAFAKVIAEFSSADPANYLQAMQREDRYLEDVWG